MKTKKLDKELKEFECEVRQAFKGIRPEPLISFEGFYASIHIQPSTFLIIEKTRHGTYELGYCGRTSCFQTLNECINAFFIKRITGLLSDVDCREIENERQSKELYELHKRFDNLYRSTFIEKIIHNEGATIVWFEDRTKVVVKRAKGVKDDVYSAVAYAMAKRLHETNTQFKRYVDSKTVKK